MGRRRRPPGSPRTARQHHAGSRGGARTTRGRCPSNAATVRPTKPGPPSSAEAGPPAGAQAPTHDDAADSGRTIRCEKCCAHGPGAAAAEESHGPWSRTCRADAGPVSARHRQRAISPASKPRPRDTRSFARTRATILLTVGSSCAWISRDDTNTGCNADAGGAESATPVRLLCWCRRVSRPKRATAATGSRGRYPGNHV